MAGAIGLPLPGERFLWLIAVLLAMLAALLPQAAQDPRRHSAVIVDRDRRPAGRPDLSALYLLAAADAAFGLGHAACSEQSADLVS